MTTSIPLNELEASPSAKFEGIGDSYAGRITGMVERQQTDTEGRLLTWNDGSPRNLWVITVETTNGDQVAFWAKGGKYTAAQGTGESMLTAIGIAVRAAGASAVEVGGELGIAYTGVGEKKPGAKGAPKLYTAQYRPPAPAAAASIPVDLFND